MFSQPPVVPSVLPLREENKLMVDNIAPTPSQIENCARRNSNAKENRHINCVIAHQF